MFTNKSISRVFSVLFILVFMLTQVGPVYAAGVWTATGSLNTARIWNTATLLSDGKVLLAGGISGGGFSSTFLSSAEFYDPSTGIWTATGSMTQPRRFFTATLLPNGKVLVTGGVVGFSAGATYLASAELYDPSTGTWTTINPMSTSRAAHTANLLPNGLVLVAGGFGGSGTWSASAELYDPFTGTWTTINPMGTSRGYHTTTLLANGQILVTGGLNGNSLNSVELYDPSVGTWTAISPLSQARYSHTATLLTDGTVLVMGGTGSAGVLSSAELYDPSMDTWTAISPMSQARYSHTATLLSDGEVLITGGVGNSGSLATAALYTPATDSWLSITPMAIARNDHSATLLLDGNVLVTGGNGNIPSAELYGEPPPLLDQMITVNIHAPASATNASNFTVAATASSGLPVSYSSSGACTNIGADFTITSGTGTCTVMYDQAGDSSYNPAPQIIENVTAQPLPTTRYVATTGSNTGNDCFNSASPCATITYAISQSVAGNTIEIAAGTYTEAGITVDKDLTLTGAGASSTIMQAAASPGTATDRVFFINSGVIATIEDMTIRHGNSTLDYGGGLYNSGTLTLNNSVITENLADYGGGGIYSNGSLIVENSTVSNNSVEFDDGGGIFNRGNMAIANSILEGNTSAFLGGGLANYYSFGTVSLTSVVIRDNVANDCGGGLVQGSGIGSLDMVDSMVANNSADNCGGGIYLAHGLLTMDRGTVHGNVAISEGGGGFYIGGGKDPGRLEMGNSTVSNNITNGDGGGLYNGGTLTLNYSTVADNVSDSDNDTVGDGGGIVRINGTLNLKSSIVAGNKKGISGITDVAADCSGTMTSQGYNLTGTGTGCNLSGPGDVTVTPANVFIDVLDVLANNGGSTQTHALIISSGNPALNAIPSGTNDCGIAPFDFDQRDEARPFDAGCDIGAYEAQSAPPATIDQTITVITSAPASAVNGSSFTVAATASSGLPVLYSSLGACTNVGADFTMTSGTGTCSVMYDQAGDSNYNPASQVTEVVNALNPAPSLNAIDPASARVGDPDVDLDVSGTGFAPNAVVRWHNNTTNTTTDLSTTYISTTELSTVLPSALLGTTGTFEVSVFNPAPGGGISVSLPFFVTQTAASIISSDTATSTNPTGTAVASTGGTGAGTPGSITASATGTGTVTVAIYDSNPRSASPFRTSGNYFDVYIAQGSNFSSVTIVACNMPSFSRVRWLDGNTWRLVNPQSYSNGCVTMNLSNTSRPTIAQLTGTIFGVEATPFNDVVLLDSQGNGLADATVRYYANGWHDIPGSTDADGVLSYDGLGLSGNVTFRISHANASIQKQQNVTNDPQVIFQTELVNMQLLASDGSTELVGDAQYYSNGWHTFGEGATNTSMELLPLNYTFRVSYGGASIQKQQNIGNDPAVVFQTELVSMQLLASDGTTELTGIGQYYANGWKTFGSGSTSTTMELLPVNYTFRVSYGGASIQKQQDVNSDAAVVFQTELVSMKLLASDGMTELTGTGQYYANGWKTFGNGSTSTSMELLPVNYTFRVSYGGASIQKQQNVSSDPAVVFQTKLVTMKLLASDGTTKLSGTGQYYANGWKTFGSGSTSATMELLPVNYTFRVSYGGASVQKQQDINSDQLVVFQTGQVHSNSATATQYYANGWKAFTQDMELLPGSYAFKFNDGTPQTTYTLIVGSVNNIH